MPPIQEMSANDLVQRPAIVKKFDSPVDRLSELGMLRRKIDPDDRRSVLLQRTVKGSVFLREYGELIVAAARRATEGDASGLPQKY